MAGTASCAKRSHRCPDRRLTAYRAAMPFDDRYHRGWADLLRLDAELEVAFAAARKDPASWGAWSVAFNQHLTLARSALGVMLRPPDGADGRMLPLYDAGIALRDLYESMNRAIAGGSYDVAASETAAELAFRRAHEAMGEAGASAG